MARTARDGLLLLWLGVALPTGQGLAEPIQDPGIRWGACEGVPLDSSRIPECAVVDRPLRAHDPEGPIIPVAVKRVPAAGETLRQLWFLDGGPGDSGRDSVERLARLLSGDRHLDVYSFDHRGVGGTSVLSCPEQQDPASPDGTELTDAEWDDCIAWIEDRPDLDALTMTETARDLHALIQRSRLRGVPVFVMGASYGTLLANRYLLLFPDQPDGVILDGVVPADWGFDEFDAALDDTGRRVLERCGSDPGCRTRLGPDPVGAVTEVLGLLSAGHCSRTGLDPALARLVFGVVLMSDASPLAFIPALAYRIRRCAWHDRMAVLELFRSLRGVGEPPSHSPVLQRHVALSEIWADDAPGATALEVALSGYLMTTAVSASFARTAERWPTYPADPLDDRFHDYRGPMLLLHGTLDPTMPIRRLDQLRGRLKGPDQAFVPVPDGGHVVINEGECIRSVYYGFLADPGAEIDTSCVATAVTLDFAGTEGAGLRIFGTGDVWGDEVGALDRAWFMVRYRVAAAALFIFLPLALWMRGLSGSWADRSPGLRRGILGLLFWTLISSAAHGAIVTVPLLAPYDGTVAAAALAVLIGMQALVGLWLARWMRRAPTRPASH